MGVRRGGVAREFGQHPGAAGRASATRSSTSIAAPSARTKPSRARSKGRQLAAGSPVPAASASIRANAAAVRRSTAASLPPASARSQLPSRSRPAASPMALAPEAQAVPTARLGPRAFRASESWPAAMLVMNSGTASGATRPPAASRSACSPQDGAPPKAEPVTTATRAPSQSAGSSPAWRIASPAATSAYWMNGPVRRARPAPSRAVASNSGTRQETRAPEPARSGSARAVECPAQTRAQQASAPRPAALTAPTPVTATAAPAVPLPDLIAHRSGRRAARTRRPANCRPPARPR